MKEVCVRVFVSTGQGAVGVIWELCHTAVYLSHGIMGLELPSSLWWHHYTPQWEGRKWTKTQSDVLHMKVQCSQTLHSIWKSKCDGSVSSDNLKCIYFYVPFFQNKSVRLMFHYGEVRGRDLWPSSAAFEGVCMFWGWKINLIVFNNGCLLQKSFCWRTIHSCTLLSPRRLIFYNITSVSLSLTQKQIDNSP